MPEAVIAAAREVTNDDILNSIKSSVPISVTMSEQIAYLRDWAEKRARPAS